MEPSSPNGAGDEPLTKACCIGIPREVAGPVSWERRAPLAPAQVAELVRVRRLHVTLRGCPSVCVCVCVSE